MFNFCVGRLTQDWKRKRDFKNVYLNSVWTPIQKPPPPFLSWTPSPPHLHPEPPWGEPRRDYRVRQFCLKYFLYRVLFFLYFSSPLPLPPLVGWSDIELFGDFRKRAQCCRYCIFLWVQFQTNRQHREIFTNRQHVEYVVHMWQTYLSPLSLVYMYCRVYITLQKSLFCLAIMFCCCKNKLVNLCCVSLVCLFSFFVCFTVVTWSV